MNSKSKKTLNDIFDDPVRSNIIWKEIEAMLANLGAKIKEGAGSRIRIELNGVKAVFHRPHPKKETDKGTIKSMRRFLLYAGVNLNKG